MAAARAGRSSASSVFTVASAAAHASGLPPKVVPWSPGAKPRAASSVAHTAPMGTPPPSPFARVMMSGFTPKAW